MAVAGVCFWIGAAFQFGLFNLPDLGPVVNALMKSGITTGGFGAIAMILYLELTNPRRMRFESKLDIEVLPELNEFMARFAERRGWDEAMKNRLSAVGEETLLTLAPLDLEGNGEVGEERRLVVVASSDGEVAELEFIGGGDDETNIEDRVRHQQFHDAESSPCWWSHLRGDGRVSVVLPWVDDFDVQVVEIFGVACGNYQIVRFRRSCDEGDS